MCWVCRVTVAVWRGGEGRCLCLCPPGPRGRPSSTRTTCSLHSLDCCYAWRWAPLRVWQLGRQPVWPVRSCTPAPVIGLGTAARSRHQAAHQQGVYGLAMGASGPISPRWQVCSRPDQGRVRAGESSAAAWAVLPNKGSCGLVRSKSRPDRSLQ